MPRSMSAKMPAKQTRHVTKSTRNTGKSWSSDELKQLKTLAKENTPTRVIGVKLRRSEAAVRSKAQAEGVSLKPTNRSPYDRRAR